MGDSVTTVVPRIVIGKETAFEGSAAGVAVTCSVAGVGGTCGAVYAPLEEIAPQAAPEQPAAETVQRIMGFGFELGAGITAAA